MANKLQDAGFEISDASSMESLAEQIQKQLPEGEYSKDPVIMIEQVLQDKGIGAKDLPNFDSSTKKPDEPPVPEPDKKPLSSAAETFEEQRKKQIEALKAMGLDLSGSAEGWTEHTMQVELENTKAKGVELTPEQEKFLEAKEADRKIFESKKKMGIIGSQDVSPAMKQRIANQVLVAKQNKMAIITNGGTGTGQEVIEQSLKIGMGRNTEVLLPRSIETLSPEHGALINLAKDAGMRVTAGAGAKHFTDKTLKKQREAVQAAEAEGVSPDKIKVPKGDRTQWAPSEEMKQAGVLESEPRAVRASDAVFANREVIVDRSDMLVALHNNNSAGTAASLNLAHKKNVPTLTFGYKKGEPKTILSENLMA
jgi:hypothetical protein